MLHEFIRPVSLFQITRTMTSKQRRKLLKSLSHDVTLRHGENSEATKSSEVIKGAAVVLRREEFICSSGHNAHLEEDFIKDETRIVGRHITSPSARSLGRRSFKKVASESSILRFFKSKSVDAHLPKSSDDASKSDAPTLESMDRRLQQNSLTPEVGSNHCEEPRSSIDETKTRPRKPPRKHGPNLTVPESGNGEIMNLLPASDEDGCCKLSESVSAAGNGDRRGSSSDPNEFFEDCDEELAISDTSTVKANNDSDLEHLSRSKRLVRQNSVSRPLYCDSLCSYDRPGLHTQASLSPIEQLFLEYVDTRGTPFSNRNGSIMQHGGMLQSQHSRFLKRESFIHPMRPPRKRMPLGTANLYQPLIINGRFQNPWSTWKRPSLLGSLRWVLSAKDNSSVPSSDELDKTLPIVPLRADVFVTPPIDGIRVTWLGHSTVLVQFDDISVITDPIFSERASPTQFLGSKRFRRFPGTVYDLPKLDAVVISHNHYDHLDYNSVLLLNARFGAELHWFVPVGLRTWMHNAGCESVTELTWWAEGSLQRSSDVTFVFTPAQHWSKRTLFDDNKVLWGSWCILGPRYRFFFAGDTGYCDVFKQIGDQFGPFDLAAIPIGTYEPRWFMHSQHVDPVEAVKIHQNVRASKSLGIHWGTFSLANENYLEPPQKLSEAIQQFGLSNDDFFVLKHGENCVVNGT